MLSWLHVSIIALVQGITEFLPISSSAHLVLVPFFLGEKDQGIAIDIAAHVGTLGAVVIYYRYDVVKLFSVGLGFLRRPQKMVLWSRNDVQTHNLLMILVATLPAVIIGGLFYSVISVYARNVLVIAVASIFFGLLLAIADRFKVKKQFVPFERKVTFWDAIMIGFSQCLAFVPGTSRSGITMTAARFCGWDRAGAARFSMWLSIPLILAALAKSLWELSKEDSFGMLLRVDFVAVVVLSFLTGILAISLLMKWLKSRSFMPFVIYRVALGLVLLAIYV